MLDFKVSVRPGRVLYICVIAGVIAYYFSIPGALVSLLAIIDIRLGKDVLNDNYVDTPEYDTHDNGGPYGPSGG